MWLTLNSFPAENPAEWGVRITFGKFHRGDVGGSGSCSKTSKKALPKLPFWSASIKSLSTTTSPRDTFTKPAPGGSKFNLRELIKPRVFGVKGHIKMTQSVVGNALSMASKVSISGCGE